LATATNVPAGAANSACNKDWVMVSFKWNILVTMVTLQERTAQILINEHLPSFYLAV